MKQRLLRAPHPSFWQTPVRPQDAFCVCAHTVGNGRRKEEIVEVFPIELVLNVWRLLAAVDGTVAQCLVFVVFMTQFIRHCSPHLLLVCFSIRFNLKSPPSVRSVNMDVSYNVRSRLWNSRLVLRKALWYQLARRVLPEPEELLRAKMQDTSFGRPPCGSGSL